MYLQQFYAFEKTATHKYDMYNYEKKTDAFSIAENFEYGLGEKKTTAIEDRVRDSSKYVSLKFQKNGKI